MGYIGMCGLKGYGFQPFWSQIWYRFQPFRRHFGHNQGIDFCTLVFNSVFFLEEATSSSRPPSPIRALPSSTLFRAYAYAGQIKPATKAQPSQNGPAAQMYYFTNSKEKRKRKKTERTFKPERKVSEHYSKGLKALVQRAYLHPLF